MAETQTPPQQRESVPSTMWDIGKAMNGLFAGPAADEQEELAAEASPDEGQDPTDEQQDKDSEGGEAEDQDAEDTSKDEPFMVLTVNGQEHKISSKEEAIPLARQGLHYTQEMQKLRDEQRRWEADREQERGKLQQTQGQYMAALQTLSDTYGFVLGKDAPDWNAPEMQKLKAEKPADYVAMREQWDQLATIRSEIGRLTNERQQKEMEAFQKWQADQIEQLKAKRPEWTDQTRRTQDHALIHEYAVAQGITDQELGALFDHRFWMILHDAARYRQAAATGKARREQVEATKTLEPGQGKGANQGDRRLRASRERLAKTGDVKAAGDIFQHMMTKPRK